MPLNRAAQINWRQKRRSCHDGDQSQYFSRVCFAITGWLVAAVPPGPMCGRPGSPRLRGRVQEAGGPRSPLLGDGVAPGEGPRGGAGGRASPAPARPGRSGRWRRTRSLQVPGATEVSARTIKRAGHTWQSCCILPEPFSPLPSLPPPRHASPVFVSGPWILLPRPHPLSLAVKLLA